MINNTLELKELFLSLGYKDDDYKKIIECYPVKHYNYETLKTRILEVYNYLLNNYSKDDVLHIAKKISGNL